MAASKIEWTEHSWNPIGVIGGGWGCTKVSPGCLNCYAERLNKNTGRNGNGRPYTGRWEFEIRDRILAQPLKRKKPTMYFVMSMGDLFHEDIPDEMITRVLDVADQRPQHILQVLTKRPERMCDVLTRRYAANPECGEHASDPAENLWLGTSIENQKAADERIPWLVKCPAAVRFLSIEPMLGEVQIDFCLRDDGVCCVRDPEEDSPVAGLQCPTGRHWINTCRFPSQTHCVDWVISGGESGPGARPCNVDWHRSLRDQCRAAGVAFYLKQMGSYAVRDEKDEHLGGYPFKLKDSKGGNPSEWPPDLQDCRAMPNVKAGATT